MEKKGRREEKEESENYYFLAKHVFWQNQNFKKKSKFYFKVPIVDIFKTIFHYLKIVWLIARFGYVLRDQFKVFTNNHHFWLL
jgi:hypothetical protein